VASGKGGQRGWFCEIRLADMSGERLRDIFGNDQDLAALPEDLQSLAKLIRVADIVLCLVNLEDFRATRDAMKKIDDEAVLKCAIDYLVNDTSRRRRMCVLFTQSDMHRQEHDRCGGWINVAKKHLPYMHGAHLLNGRVSVAAVAAVADTTIVETDGNPRRVPAAGFYSIGLENVMEWVSEKAQEVFTNRLADLQKIEAARRAKFEQQRQLRSMQTIKWVVACIALVVVLGALLFATTISSKPTNENRNDTNYFSPASAPNDSQTTTSQ
jgi:hypothetical protein